MTVEHSPTHTHRVSVLFPEGGPPSPPTPTVIWCEEVREWLREKDAGLGMWLDDSAKIKKEPMDDGPLPHVKFPGKKWDGWDWV